MNPSPTEDLQAALLELTASLHILHGALTDFQHSLIEAQIGGGDQAARQALATARQAIDQALGGR